MDRRTFLAGAALGAGASVFGGGLWRGASAALALPGLSPYGAVRKPDANGLRLPAGFTSRVVARSGQRVPGTSYVWHGAPDGGACFADGSGWVYVSNSELSSGGGVGMLRFSSRGTIVGASRILSNTRKNCAGGATPWKTWLSCEEVDRGYVYEARPFGGAATRRSAMGRFKHEAAAVDPIRRHVYLTEDEPDGCLYRFVPANWPSLTAGKLQVACGSSRTSGPIGWVTVPDPDGSPTRTRHQVAGAKHFNGGEGCVYGADKIWLSTKGDGRIWLYDILARRISLSYDDSLVGGIAPLTGVDNLLRSTFGDLFVAEDKGNMEICLISAAGLLSTFLRVEGHTSSEITGLAFSPDGSRLYFSSQRGALGTNEGGITYEISGPFRT
ncbi:MAG: alkaline phosphatase PhoX [Sporichthyaceae bacterium]